MKTKVSQFSIRRKKKEKHPQVIVESNKTKFKSMSLTHSKKDGRSNNLPLKHNPNHGDNKLAYLKKRIIEDFKFRYTKAFQNYHLSNEDIEELIQFLQSKKKK